MRRIAIGRRRIGLRGITISISTILVLTASIEILNVLSLVTQIAMVAILKPLITSSIVVLVVASSKLVWLCNCDCVHKVASAHLIYFCWRKLNVFIVLFTDVWPDAFCTYINVLILCMIYFFIYFNIFYIML